MSGKSSAFAVTLRAVGWAGLGAIAIAVALSDFLAPAPQGASGRAPMLQAPSDAHPFGSDLLGRDVMSEALHGLSVTLGHALLATLVVVLLGGLAGAVAARLPNYLRGFLRWLFGVFAAIPALLLAILIVGLTGRDYAALAAGLAAAPFAFVRAFDKVDLKSSHAEYAKATGISPTTLLRRDLTYEFRDTLAPVAARALAAVTIILATLGFLGFGAVPPARDLGLMIAAAKANYLHAWWVAAFPAAVLVALILFARLAAGLDEGERA